ncbi:MAG: PleD family two-component system response regulator [Rickettsiales bacterium]|nr:PleD family two-component system response regulator [Rickettsiales bacterium]
MTALILVVDDVPANVKLLEAKLSNEYYDVITAKDGFEAIAQAKQHKPDIILLDVMMPGMDGFETCRKMKEDIAISHIPVVMVTALSDPSDRVSGLEAGADDFLTKPINDTALLARVRSLVRIKVLLDELRLRDKTGLQMGVMNENQNSFTSDVSGSHVVVIDDDIIQSNKLLERLRSSYRVTHIDDAGQALAILQTHQDVDLVVISTQLNDVDALRLCAHMRNVETMRNVPIIMLVEEEEMPLVLKGLELGINDYLMLPVDQNEMIARVKTQIRRKKYQDALKQNYQSSISMAITDALTGLYNRHYLDAHLHNMVSSAITNKKPLSLLIMDMDHFKSVNDTYGHDVGDEVLKQLSKRIVDSVRSSDLAARIGGEEFVILMPETDVRAAYGLAERIRNFVARTPFVITHEVGQITKTISIGLSSLNLQGDAAADLIKRADTSLYAAKNGGRNQTLPVPEGMYEPVVEVAETGF